jgi:hypothetical protein
VSTSAALGWFACSSTEGIPYLGKRAGTFFFSTQDIRFL